MQLIKKSIQQVRLKIVGIIACDALFYTILVTFALTLANKVLQRSDSVNLNYNINNLNEAAAQSIATDLTSFFLTIAGSVAVFILGSIILITTFKGIIWNLTANKNIKKFKFKNFLKLNFKIITIVSALFLFIFIFVKPESYFWYIITLGVMAVYFTSILYSLFLQKDSTSIKQAIKIGIQNKTIFKTFTIIVAGYILLTALFKTIPLQVHPIIIGAALLTYIAWSRYFFTEAAKHVL